MVGKGWRCKDVGIVKTCSASACPPACVPVHRALETVLTGGQQRLRTLLENGICPSPRLPRLEAVVTLVRQVAVPPTPTPYALGRVPAPRMTVFAKKKRQERPTGRRARRATVAGGGSDRTHGRRRRSRCGRVPLRRCHRRERACRCVGGCHTGRVRNQQDSGREAQEQAKARRIRNVPPPRTWPRDCVSRAFATGGGGGRPTRTLNRRSHAVCLPQRTCPTRLPTMQQFGGPRACTQAQVGRGGATRRAACMPRGVCRGGMRMGR
eukprot:349801-Chlamydomonas_euryale.AAC.44